MKTGKERMVERLRLPKDLMLGAAIVTVTGTQEICVENYKGIMEYTTEKIRLQAKGCSIEITGFQLNIEYYTNDEMKITGEVRGICYRK